MFRLHHPARLLVGSLIGLSLCLTAASGGGLEDFGARAAGDLDPAPGCPTRFDYEVLASAADSGKFIGLSVYRFRRETRYSAAPLGEFQRVAARERELGCQGGGVAGMRASAAPRRSSQIT
jgi:hypothetical protein